MSEEQGVNLAESTAPEAPADEKDSILDTLTSDEDKPVVESETKEEAPAESQESEEPEESKPADDQEESEDKPQSRADKRTNQLNEEIRSKVAERNALKAEIEQLNAQVYELQTAEELEAEGYKPTDARVAALEQKLELSEFNNRVVEANMALNEESLRVLNEFPEFSPTLPDGSKNPDFDQDIANEAAELLAANLIRDPNTGQIIGYHASPYQIYKPIAMAHRKSQVAGQIKGQKATEKMLASVDAPASASPKPKKADPIMDILKADD